MFSVICSGDNINFLPTFQHPGQRLRSLWNLFLLVLIDWLICCFLLLCNTKFEVNSPCAQQLREFFCVRISWTNFGIQIWVPATLRRPWTKFQCKLFSYNTWHQLNTVKIDTYCRYFSKAVECPCLILRLMGRSKNARERKKRSKCVISPSSERERLRESVLKGLRLVKIAICLSFNIFDC